MKLFTVAEMVAAEKAADAAGVTYDQMMESAGQAVAEAIIARYPVAGRAVTVLVGPGNNGGDGLVAGRHLAQAGADVAFYLFKPRDPEKDANLVRVQEMGLFVLTADFDQRYRVLRTRLNITDIVVDALLGTGVDRPIGGELARLMKQVQGGLEERAAILADKRRSRLVSVAALNEEGEEVWPTHPIVVAVDCPSGLNADSGEIDPLALPAGLTVTFAGPKRGHFRFPGAAACGELVVADIGISPELPEVAGVAVEVVTAGEARRLLLARPKDGHKGTFGWVLVAAGSQRYWGAPALAGRAAYRAGAGLVALAVPAAIRPALAVQLPEATYPLIADENVLGAAAAQAILEDIAAYKALLVGPGLYQADDFLETLLAAREQLPPLVVDADGLNLLAQVDDWPARLPANTILTPHPGEMARLMGVKPAELRARDRIELAREKAAEWNCILLLKGAYTVVAGPGGRCALLPFANPALATAGSGDVLSGVIVALLGQGLAAYEAAVLGGYLHGAAGELAGVDAGLLAGEIADWVPEVREGLRAE
ncbi:MAG: NAD(P)H-hydrate dehydratase [Chloroflexi bacterium]|nr:NAD(P)H-hydrate dehydratase [Chloroflexota bacterium]MCI0647705.1 NAD(P)H-hydrate dehydratase [Chloroflexota bacterium]